jgi:hypothetical protein
MPTASEINAARVLLRKELEARQVAELNARHAADTSHPAHALRAASQAAITKSLSGETPERGRYEPISKEYVETIEKLDREVFQLMRWADQNPDASEADIDKALNAQDAGLPMPAAASATKPITKSAILADSDAVILAAAILAKSEGITVERATIRVLEELGRP